MPYLNKKLAAEASAKYHEETRNPDRQRERADRQARAIAEFWRDQGVPVIVTVHWQPNIGWTAHSDLSARALTYARVKT